MARVSWTIACFFGVATLVACSTFPEYAAPKGRIVDPATLGSADVIAYRTLTRADFKSEKPPPEFAPVAEKVGAATCAYILTAPETQVMIHPFRAPDGGILYRATSHRLRFIAQMDRSCSWWNPRDRGMPMDYILEHEQVHFAIFELEARRLNESIPEIEARVHATAADPDAAVQMLHRRLETHLEGRIGEILQRSREFDEDTSLGHNPAKQKRWWDTVRSELAAPTD